MATKQFVISANTGAAVTITGQLPSGANPDARSIYIRNYANAIVNPGQGSMWVAFGAVATAGTNGEMEIVPGDEYSYGGPLPPSTLNLPGGTRLPNCPTEFISVISTGGTAVGCVVVQ